MIKNETNELTFVKIEAKGFQQICDNLKNLEHKNEFLENDKKQLRADLRIVGDELTYFKDYAANLEDEVNQLKARCRKLACENHDLQIEIRDMKFTRKYLTSEDAGRKFAESLLGGA